MLDHTARTRIVLSFTVLSWPTSTTWPSLNAPTFEVSVPTLLFANDWLHWCAVGLYRKSVRPSQRPLGPSASISSSCALPSHTLRTLTVPFSSTDAELLANGSRIRVMWVRHTPTLKSKSC